MTSHYTQKNRQNSYGSDGIFYTSRLASWALK